MRAPNYAVCITTYEFIVRDKAVLSKVKWQYCIIDEGHRMKNSGSKLSTTLVQAYSCRYRLILTGTPLQVRFFNWSLVTLAAGNDEGNNIICVSTELQC